MTPPKKPATPIETDCCLAWMTDYKSRYIETHPKRFAKTSKAKDDDE